MKNRKNQILDEDYKQPLKALTEQQLQGLVQFKIRYPKYILSKIDAQLLRQKKSKEDLLNKIKPTSNENSFRENLILFWNKNLLWLILVVLFAPFPFGTLVVIGSIYFSLKKFSL